MPCGCGRRAVQTKMIRFSHAKACHPGTPDAWPNRGNRGLGGILISFFLEVSGVGRVSHAHHWQRLAVVGGTWWEDSLSTEEMFVLWATSPRWRWRPAFHSMHSRHQGTPPARQGRDMEGRGSSFHEHISWRGSKKLPGAAHIAGKCNGLLGGALVEKTKH